MIATFRRLAIASLLLSFALSASAAQINTTLPKNVQQALSAHKLPGDALSLAVLPLTGPGTPTFINADVPLNPASTMKLVTTYAALELLGPTHKWRTEFYADGPLRDGVLDGNLYLKGGGDPKLNMEKLWLLMRDLRANGVREVHGDLVLDRSHFVKPQLPAFNDDGGDSNKPFLVEPDSLLINLKALRFIARAEPGKVQVSIEPPIAGMTIDNQAKVLPASACPDWPDVRYNLIPQEKGYSMVVTGKLPAGCSAQSYIAPLDHQTYAAGAVRAIWQELGGSIQGQDRLGEVPRQARLLVRAFSPDVVEIIRDVNKFSNNTMARQLFLSIGEQFRTSADTDDAQAAYRAVRQWMTRKGIDAQHLVMENGSGLSRAERISAREMAEMLKAAWHSPYAAEFIASMPLVAMDGTMRKRLRRTPLVGEAHIKTGTLKTVRAIAGFSRDQNGNTWVVVALLNHPRPWGASSILDQVLVDLYRQPKLSNTAQR
ncbi:D-alanyl-D-alanine carboxypeptidase/D-alanyl-D-alanine-endopeptidase [Azotobacter armeniacus]